MIVEMSLRDHRRWSSASWSSLGATDGVEAPDMDARRFRLRRLISSDSTRRITLRSHLSSGTVFGARRGMARSLLRTRSSTSWRMSSVGSSKAFGHRCRKTVSIVWLQRSCFSQRRRLSAKRSAIPRSLVTAVCEPLWKIVAETDRRRLDGLEHGTCAGLRPPVTVAFLALAKLRSGQVKLVFQNFDVEAQYLRLKSTVEVRGLSGPPG
jgi:hypothetical protein